MANQPSTEYGDDDDDDDDYDDVLLTTYTYLYAANNYGFMLINYYFHCFHFPVSSST